MDEQEMQRYEEIDRYLLGKMGPDASADFKERLEKDPNLSEAVRKQQFVQAVARMADREALREEILQAVPQLKPRRRPSRFLILGSAAAVLITVMLGSLLLMRPDYNAIVSQGAFANHLAQNLGPQSPAQAFFNKDYQLAKSRALANLKQNPVVKADDLAITGLSLLQLNKADSALYYFGKMLEDAQSTELGFEAWAHYYEALAWLKRGDQWEAAVRIAKAERSLKKTSTINANKLQRQISRLKSTLNIY